MGQITAHVAPQGGALNQHIRHFVLTGVISYAGSADWGLPFLFRILYNLKTFKFSSDSFKLLLIEMFTLLVLYKMFFYFSKIQIALIWCCDVDIFVLNYLFYPRCRSWEYGSCAWQGHILYFSLNLCCLKCADVLDPAILTDVHVLTVLVPMI